MNMKKLVFIFVAVVAISSISSCNGQNGQAQSIDSLDIEIIEESMLATEEDSSATMDLFERVDSLIRGSDESEATKN